LDHHTYDFVAM